MSNREFPNPANIEGNRLLIKEENNARKFEEETIHMGNQIEQTNEICLRINSEVSETNKVDNIDIIKKELPEDYDSADYVIVCNGTIRIANNFKQNKDISLKLENDEPNDKINFDEAYHVKKNSINLAKHGQTFKQLINKSNNLPKKYQCNICRESFDKNGQITRHLLIKIEKLQLEKEKNWLCLVCQKSFKKNYDLKRHSLIHTGEKKYQCNICFKSFSQHGNLNRHMLSHTEEKLQHCNICQKSFNLHGTLKTHMLSHTGEKKYQCNICEKSYIQQSSLSRHMLFHADEKKYRCTVCQKSFLWLPNLKEHLLIHTGEKNYQCNVCQKTFNRKRYLTKHLAIHHKEKG